MKKFIYFKTCRKRDKNGIPTKDGAYILEKAEGYKRIFAETIGGTNFEVTVFFSKDSNRWWATEKTTGFLITNAETLKACEEFVWYYFDKLIMALNREDKFIEQVKAEIKNAYAKIQ